MSEKYYSLCCGLFQILQSSHAFNRSIIQLEQMIPELSKFHIHVDLESENVLASMEETVKSLESLKNTYVEKCQSLEDENIESHKIIQDKKQQLELLQQAIKAEESKKAQKMMENAALIKSFEDVRYRTSEAAFFFLQYQTLLLPLVFHLFAENKRIN